MEGNVYRSRSIQFTLKSQSARRVITMGHSRLQYEVVDIGGIVRWTIKKYTTRHLAHGSDDLVHEGGELLETADGTEVVIFAVTTFASRAGLDDEVAAITQLLELGESL